MKRTLGLLALLLLALTPAAVSAQWSPDAFEASAGYSSWGGNNLKGLRAGPRFQATLFGEAGDGQIGFTGAFGSVGIDGLSQNAKEWGVGVTGRKLMGRTNRTRPFVDGYVGWTRLQVAASEGPSFREIGLAVGPGAGVSLPVGSAALVVAGDVRWHYFRNVTDASGLHLTLGGKSGWRFGVRAGIVLGSWS